ncbi:hypothetical protein M9H77_37183 [Catharanthus roseus]|uniref:Uncharacterized protein n=1 Tax=Catharanthus roseus TaxID=4058 RepID=A0ACB9ZUQ7_CATRO|nr:hypothetical protein M9H77_37183 [Catharanthus roseus]
MFSSTSVIELILPIGFTLLLGLAVFKFILSRSLFVKKEPANIPHGSMGWPFIGETLGYLKPHHSNSIGSFLQDRCSRYGNIFKSHLFGTPTIVSCDLELNTFILQNEEKFFKVYYPKPVKDILGKFSMIIVSGEEHKKLRSVAVNFITISKSSLDFLGYVEKLAIKVMEPWKNQREVFFFQEAKQFTLHLMLKNLLNMEPGDPLASKILQDFLTFMKGFISIPINLPGTSFAKAFKARMRISSTLRDIIRERRGRNKLGVSKEDFLDSIMKNEELNDDEKISVLLDILLAGYETTSGLMALILYFLAHSPSALQQLKEEHLEVRGCKKDSELLNLEDYKKMEFTSHVISEALRCGNLVKFVHRKAIKDVKFKEFVIPEGWQVLPVFSAPHLNPSLHENPSEFNPWRWNDAATSKKVTMFGGGVRLCPGAELGRVETAFFLHHLVLKYRWKIKEDECPISYPFVEFKRSMVLEMEPIG